MRALPRPPFLSLVCLSLLLLAGSGPVSAADDTESKRVHFTTYDEVELSGTFYRSMPAAGKRDKDAVVLLLHDFRHATGGGSKEDGWNSLAGQLQKNGYSVLSFDFRGFGNSKSVSPKFWMHPHNQRFRGARSKAASIDQKEFSNAYYPLLVNDIAAARAHLNTMNDVGEVNASNIIIIGAGQGATLGALWMASECRRQRDPTSDRLSDGRLPDWSNPLKSFDDPEGNDLAAAVWLTISPSLETRALGGPLRTALVDSAKNAKIPTYFLYGNRDQKAEDLATTHLKAITTENGKEVEQKGVRKKAIPNVGDLAGSKLLAGRFKTTEYIVDYLNRVLEDRGTRVRKERADQKYAFCWAMPWPTARSVHRVLAKLPGETTTRIIPPNVLGLGR
jgi:hypothetical protein